MQKIILIRKRYEDEWKNLEDLGSEIFDYVWTEDINSFEDLSSIVNRMIWYRGPIEDEQWRQWMRKLNIYNIVLNHPDLCIKSAIKSDFYKTLSGLDFMPKCWYSPKDAEYPCVEKPNNSHSGKGVRILNSIEDADTSNGDVWMELIEFESEWRVWCFNNTILGTYWRKPNIGIGDKTKDEEVDFDYIPKELPNQKLAQSVINQVWQRFPLQFQAVDLFYKDNKWYICEVNAQPGYKEEVWKNTIKFLKIAYL